MKSEETNEKTLPPPWDRIFSLTTRCFVWGLLIAVLYLLRPFLLLVFLTFVFAYIQAHGVEGLGQRIKNRPLRVIIVGLVFLGTLFAAGLTLVPQVQEQANQFLNNRQTYIKDADKQVNIFLSDYPWLEGALTKYRDAPDPTMTLGASSPESNPSDTEPDSDNEQAGQVAPKDGKQDQGQNPADEPNSGEPSELRIVQDLVAGIGESLAKNPIEIGQSVLSYASSFLLSLLFSFLIVLDLRKITRGIKGLGGTKIGFIYDEVAENIAGFGRMLGRALEAQLFIAICNTILTAIGIWFLGLPNLLVLSTIVFFCSFIPVAGTFISSTPIALLALQSGGVTTMMIAIVIIMVVHALETYVLNPQIYGHHMHMNPVLVLIVLTIGGKLFGIWGLLLGIPIVNYVFRHAIRYPEQKPAET